MAHHIKSPQKNNSGPVIMWTSLVLASLGILDASYLLVYKLTNNNAMCLGNGGCHDVNFSPYSQIAGIPVSLFGLAAYLVMAVILLLEGRLKIVKDNGPLAIFGISLAGTVFTGYLTWIELYVIHKLCPFCVATAIIITLIFILAVIRLVKQTAF
jgi:Predicted membrane protein